MTSTFISTHFDTSNSSMLLGLFTLVVMFFTSKYILENFINSDEDRINMYSVLSSLLLTIIALFVYTKVIKHWGRNSYLTEDF